MFVSWLICFFGGLGRKFSYPSPLRGLWLIAFKMIGRSHAPPPRCSQACQPGLPWMEVGDRVEKSVAVFVFTYLCNPEGQDFARAPAAPSGRVCNLVASRFVRGDSDRLVGKCLACIRWVEGYGAFPGGW